MAELDDIGSETASMMRTMLQMAILVAVKSREHGQKDAEARAKAIEAKMKEARELQIREARDLKAKDPRNVELVQMMSLGSRTVESRGVEARGISLNKDAASPFAASAAAQPANYDSTERRAAIAAHLQRAGVAPELSQVRMLVEMGHGISPDEAIRLRDAATRTPQVRARGLERGVELGIERGIERGR
ncbi:hypothetical protein [Nocardia alba]|uniref:Uncharacterized protein n=1 Tax=Nocardia alba TaxID=225051 RepID=A0A4R1FV07_9NOCA|nr:hypothetical protein [Nocardia alba]TCJ95091.1 hypothetical protein DFR71_4005 [Nocardia alba]